MAPVAVQDVRYRSLSWAEANNTASVRAQWSRAISQKADYVQLVTWNDYSESTQIAPSQDHGSAFLDLTRYYTFVVPHGIAAGDHVGRHRAHPPHAVREREAVVLAVADGRPCARRHLDCGSRLWSRPSCRCPPQRRCRSPSAARPRASRRRRESPPTRCRWNWGPCRRRSSGRVRRRSPSPPRTRSCRRRMCRTCSTTPSAASLSRRFIAGRGARGSPRAPRPSFRAPRIDPAGVLPWVLDVVMLRRGTRQATRLLGEGHQSRQVCTPFPDEGRSRRRRANCSAVNVRVAVDGICRTMSPDAPVMR